MYTVEISRKALKELKKLPIDYIKKFREKFQELAENPYDVQGTKKLINPKSLGIDLEEVYRIRVGDYRAIYSIENNVLTIYILKVAHRKEVYQ
ncbi:type II toxin-antitoxin system RelE family toxin [Emticicia agri]|uniref:Type II toxin-antitoxin system RelE/ParE family toxin n=1 Tax=Emticicia agri TaxID=2492393 RepID=A0A4Q5LXL1_9BACT|nr:type II toxin-antitoxin system RelE/ParE family toxin [Emticicia agri]RYU94365.1 type II toxin-antitoxin system RelE/ParE family toxin [Emticicia agri]